MPCSTCFFEAGNREIGWVGGGFQMTTQNTVCCPKLAILGHCWAKQGFFWVGGGGGGSMKHLFSSFVILGNLALESGTIKIGWGGGLK